VTDQPSPFPGLPWPERVDALFQDGPLAGQMLPVPARVGFPPLVVGVLLDQSGRVIEIRADTEVPGVDDRDLGWVRYTREPGPRFGEPHVFVHRVPGWRWSALQDVD